jgi:hypothetical protein
VSGRDWTEIATAAGKFGITYPTNDSMDKFLNTVQSTERRWRTGGVWSADFDEAVKIKDARGNTIATLAQTFLRGLRSASEVGANAHLMAASPELYEALNYLVGVFEHHAETPEEVNAIGLALNVLGTAEGDEGGAK